MQDLLTPLIYSFSALFVILDPLLSVPIFTSMTKDMTAREVNRQALIAVVVAGVLMYIFLFFNFLIFDSLGITLPSFQVAGGILLFILGLQMALGIEIGPSHSHSHTAAGVVIGTPLLCGPGAITTVPAPFKRLRHFGAGNCNRTLPDSDLDNFEILRDNPAGSR